MVDTELLFVSSKEGVSSFSVRAKTWSLHNRDSFWLAQAAAQGSVTLRFPPSSTYTRSEMHEINKRLCDWQVERGGGDGAYSSYPADFALWTPSRFCCVKLIFFVVLII